MRLYLISPAPGFLATVKAALESEDVKTFATPTDLLQHLLESSRSASDLALLELDRMSEPGRFIDFIKGSPRISNLKVLAVGTDEQLLALDAGTSGKTEGKLRAPFRPAELAALVAQINKAGEESER